VRRPIPPPLEHLLDAGDRTSREAAWAEFLEEYSRLILHVARSLGGSHDDAMDRYAHALDQLRRDDYRRLRGYAADGRGKFTTWLVLVVRRLCLDEVRRRYGRARGGSTEAHEARRRLADLVAADVDTDLLPASARNPEQEAGHRELRGILTGAIAELEPADRLMLRLRFQDEVAVAEIARIFSFPNVFPVYRRLKWILAQLRTALQAAGVEDAAS
jgi:RNA polymerase sigma factor (sigma-70 family)